MPADKAVGARFGDTIRDGAAVPFATADRDNAVIRVNGVADAVYRVEKLFKHRVTCVGLLVLLLLR